uniref:Uncharacterized protein n=1 Tax=Anguilla anguilla TaxID=7936 RepID=A0A0E9P8Y1_ANGAN
MGTRWGAWTDLLNCPGGRERGHCCPPKALSGDSLSVVKRQHRY